ncbi:MAG: 4Fe-4S dicluster domain-containing protein [Chloroflexi bacterium]|nr:4Fe-4S dicluster domain-containing protein [Chloroflexota bacterium]
MSVEIIIDKEKCKYSMYDPQGCKKCMSICGASVFATRPTEKRDFSIPKEQRLDPTIWQISAPWADVCNLCGACLKVCPHGALAINVDGKPLDK